MRGFVSLFLLMMTCVILSRHSVSGEKRKFAPPYCLSLRFNCARDSHADHICCKFPLPEGESSAVARRPHPFIKIRPIVRPKPPVHIQETESTEEGEDTKTEEKKAAADISPNPPTTPAPPTTTTSRQSSRKGSRTRPNVNSNVQPRICKRITVDCQDSPDHRCCQNAAPTASATTTSTTTTTASTTTPPPEYFEGYEYSDEIPTECYTAELDCDREPSHPCCAYY